MWVKCNSCLIYRALHKNVEVKNHGDQKTSCFFLRLHEKHVVCTFHCFMSLKRLDTSVMGSTFNLNRIVDLGKIFHIYFSLTFVYCI